jgi:hypothetical protein
MKRLSRQVKARNIASCIARAVTKPGYNLRIVASSHQLDLTFPASAVIDQYLRTCESAACPGLAVRVCVQPARARMAADKQDENQQLYFMVHPSSLSVMTSTMFPTWWKPNDERHAFVIKTVRLSTQPTGGDDVQRLFSAPRSKH